MRSGEPKLQGGETTEVAKATVVLLAPFGGGGGERRQKEAPFSPGHESRLVDAGMASERRSLANAKSPGGEDGVEDEVWLLKKKLTQTENHLQEARGECAALQVRLAIMRACLCCVAMCKISVMPQY